MGGVLGTDTGSAWGVGSGGVLGAAWGVGTGEVSTGGVGGVSGGGWGVCGKLDNLLNVGGFDFGVNFFIGLLVTSGLLGEPADSEAGVSLATAGTTILMSMR